MSWFAPEWITLIFQLSSLHINQSNQPNQPRTTGVNQLQGGEVVGAFAVFIKKIKKNNIMSPSLDIEMSLENAPTVLGFAEFVAYLFLDKL